MSVHLSSFLKRPSLEEVLQDAKKLEESSEHLNTGLELEEKGKKEQKDNPKDKNAGHDFFVSANHEYDMAIMDGESKGKAYLGTSLLKGRGVEHSHEARREAKHKALRLLHETEDEYWRSAENLAIAYSTGDGVTKDPNVAIDKYKKALELFRKEKASSNPNSSPLNSQWEEHALKEIRKLEDLVSVTVNVPVQYPSNTFALKK